MNPKTLYFEARVTGEGWGPVLQFSSLFGQLYFWQVEQAGWASRATLMLGRSLVPGQ